MNKMIKSAICVVTSLAVAVPFAAVYSKKNAKAAEGEKTTTTTAVVTTTTTQTTTDALAVTVEAASKAKTEKEKTTNKEKTTKEKTTKDKKTTAKNEKTTRAAEPKVKYVVKKSEILKNANSVQRWSVSNGKMSVKAEQIELYLNNNGNANEKVKRYAYVAIIKGTPDGFKSISATQTTGNTVDTISNIASKANAVFAVNGEMCNHTKESFHGFFNAYDDTPTGTVIKNGQIPQADKATPSLTMDKNGNWEYPVVVSPDNAQNLIGSGVITSMSYTYPVIWDGKPAKNMDGVIAPMWNERDTVLTNPKAHYYNDHTLIGQIDANTYVVAVSESFGRGHLCDIMTELGVQKAFWANGGHCAAMYIKGYGVVNRVGDKKLCSSADVMYF